MQTTFSATLLRAPIVPESIRVSDGRVLLMDSDPDRDGTGQFGPPAEGGGTVNYVSGALTVTFVLPPAAGAEVQVTYERGQ